MSVAGGVILIQRKLYVEPATVVLFTDEAGRVLLVKQSYRPEPRNWALPGGGLDDDGPPRVGALREVAEELGLNVRLGRLLAVNWRPATDRPPLIVYAFDGGILTEEQVGRIKLLDGELTDVGFFTIDEAEPLLYDADAHRQLAYALAVCEGRLPFSDLCEGFPDLRTVGS